MHTSATIEVETPDYKIFYNRLTDELITKEYLVLGIAIPGKKTKAFWTSLISKDKKSIPQSLFYDHAAKSASYFWGVLNGTRPNGKKVVNRQALLKALNYIGVISRDKLPDVDDLKSIMYLWTKFIEEEKNEIAKRKKRLEEEERIRNANQIQTPTTEISDHNNIQPTQEAKTIIEDRSAKIYNLKEAPISHVSDLLAGPFNFTCSNINIWTNSTNEFKTRTLFTDTNLLIDDRFAEINKRRRSKSLKPFPTYTKYRLVAYKVEGSKFTIHVMPATFAHLKVYHEYYHTDDYVRDFFDNAIQTQADELKAKSSDEALIYVDAFYLLGMECCIFTSDNYCFIRKRGQHMHASTNQWTTGLNGFVGLAEMAQSGLVNVFDSMVSEIGYKISETLSMGREIIFTGFHRNTDTNALDVFLYWKLEASAEQLRNKISYDKADHGEIFQTQISKDTFLLDTVNLLFPLDPIEQEKCFRANDISCDMIVPESLMAMQIAMNYYSN